MSNKIFSVEVPIGDKKAMDEFQEIMNEIQNFKDKEAKEIAESLKIKLSTALDIQYLRTRSRWTQEAENELIRRDHAGEEMPNIMEWP